MGTTPEKHFRAYDVKKRVAYDTPKRKAYDQRECGKYKEPKYVDSQSSPPRINENNMKIVEIVARWL